MRIAILALAAMGMLTPSQAHAFCGFYVSGADAKLFNEATQVVLMRDGMRTVLSMQNAYQGPPEAFAMVVPVPVVLQKENVKTLPREIFDKVDKLTAPRLVEYWEQDPCRVVHPHMPAPRTMAKGGGALAEPEAPRDHGVKIEAQFTVGEYEVVILSARDSSGLDAWLRENKYKIPDGAEPYLRPYVQAGSKFFVAKVDPKKVTFEGGRAMLAPLRFHYDSDSFNLPVRLGLINSGGKQDLIVNILAKGQRYEAANYPNVTIPTNIDVDEKAKDGFGAMYAALYDRTLEQKPNAVVTEYSWDASTCDPCPLPALNPGELTTLGADVLASSNPELHHPGVRGIPRWGGGWVITRLHARYAKEALGEDIVFRAAPPITGGREVRPQDGKLEKGASSGHVNNFQARYAIRHPWTGEIKCDNPRRGIWGGPPSGGSPSTRPADKIAFAPRGGIALPALLKESVPELGLDAPKATLPAPAPAPATDIPRSDPKKGCGCGVAEKSPLGWAGALAGIALLIARRKVNR
jgi:MYXO-CTERM domain-containing protein